MSSAPICNCVADLIPAGVRVLDLGCGDGALLDYLIHYKQSIGRGIELSETGMLACVRRGLSVRQGNLQEGLADYPDNSFDYVVLSQTLSFLDDPQMILAEMLRVGRCAIVSFPNWGHWRARVLAVDPWAHAQSAGSAATLVRRAALAGIHRHRLCAPVCAAQNRDPRPALSRRQTPC